MSFKIKIPLILVCLLMYAYVHSQDCINYWKFNDKLNESYNYQNKYFVVPEGCLSKLISESETMEINFELIHGRDYKITIGTDMPGSKALVKIYNTDDNVLLYDNAQNDSLQVVEFEIVESRKVKAIITLPLKNKPTNDKNKYHASIMLPKVNRYCVGIRLETMITPK